MVALFLASLALAGGEEKFQADLAKAVADSDDAYLRAFLVDAFAEDQPIDPGTMALMQRWTGEGISMSCRQTIR